VVVNDGSLGCNNLFLCYFGFYLVSIWESRWRVIEHSCILAKWLAFIWWDSNFTW